MSISFILGKPGGGKGFFSVKMAIDELRSRHPRPIITNLAFKFEPWVTSKGVPQVGLNAYMRVAHGMDQDFSQKIFIIDESQAREFYRWRVVNGKLVCSDLIQGEGSKVPDAMDTTYLNQGGVLYIIDEVWKFFGSRDWQQTGKVALWYQAQHRKFGDDVMFCTQNSKQVDTAFRQIAQDFTVVQNHGKMRLGLFRQPDLFSVATYPAPPAPAVAPMCRSVMRMDVKGIGGCYDTSAGVGLAGQTVADVGRKGRGLHWGWFVAAAVGILLFCVFAPRLLGGKVAQLFSPVVPKPIQTVPQPLPQPVTNQVQVVTNAPYQMIKFPEPKKQRRQEVERIDLEERTAEPDEEKLQALVRVGDKIFVATDKGVYRPGDPDLEYVGKDKVIIRGRLYKFARKEPNRDHQPTTFQEVSRVP